MTIPILVTGAAGRVGAVGRTVTELLLKQGQAVQAMVRTEDERAQALRALGAEVVVGNLLGFRRTSEHAVGDAEKTRTQEHARVGDVLNVSSPRGTFILEPGEQPAVLLSAGIGATPVLAMLHALAANRSTRQIFWLHAARNAQHHPFASEARTLIDKLPNARARVCYSRPGAGDKMGEHFDFAGRLSRSVFDEIGIPRDSDAYLCGPSQFMADMKETLAAFGVAPQRIHAEIFSGDTSKTPGGIRATHKAPHQPADGDNTGPLVSFARSGIAAHWNASKYQSILELAEACDVPALWSCRTGVCHNCESGLVSGAVVYGPEPLEKAADGNLLVCCSQPVGNVVIDL